MAVCSIPNAVHTPKCVGHSFLGLFVLLPLVTDSRKALRKHVSSFELQLFAWGFFSSPLVNCNSQVNHSLQLLFAFQLSEEEENIRLSSCPQDLWSAAKRVAYTQSSAEVADGLGSTWFTHGSAGRGPGVRLVRPHRGEWTRQVSG